MKLSKFKKAPYNPRIMSPEAKDALRSSIETFSDISGIVINNTTRNVLAGNHRLEVLYETYGKENLALKEITPTLHSIMAGEKDTGFIVRIVEWPEAKEKAANVSANSELIMGEFTSGLQDLLAEIEASGLPINLESLRFDELSLDLSDLSDAIGAENESTIDKIQKEAREKNDALSDAGNESSEVKTILGLIKLSVSGEIIDEVKSDIQKFLSRRYYKDDVTIL